MIALAIGMGVLALAALAAATTFGLKALSAMSARVDSDKEALAQKERADAAVQERDSDVVLLTAERAKTADLMLAKAQVESERNALVKEVAALNVKLLATMPVSDEGAKVVNDMFATPIGDALEKP